MTIQSEVNATRQRIRDTRDETNFPIGTSIKTIDQSNI